MMRCNWYRRGNTRDVVRRRRRVDLERVRTSCFPRPYAFVERLAPAVAAMGGAAVVAHRPLGCYCCEKTKQERRRYETRGPDDADGAGDLAFGFGLAGDERFALCRTDCGSARRGGGRTRRTKLFSCQLGVPAARFHAPLRFAGVVRA